MSVSKTFSESWHRVADQRIQLRSGIDVQRQRFRGEEWMVLGNPLNNEFFRLPPATYDFVARLSPHKTVAEVWEECMQRSPDSTPGQEAVITLLGQLYQANLLHYELAADAEQLFQRQRKRKRAEMGMKWLNLMFIRIPLCDPDRFLKASLPLVSWLISPFGLLLWLLVVSAGVKVAIDNSDRLFEQAQGVLAPANVLWLYLAMAVVKLIHEFGHGYFCRKYGGEVHVMGVMLMVLTPIPFVDATASWGFRRKRHRILVAAAGMIVELVIAAIAVMIWARTSPGLLHSVMFNIIFVASVSTLLFNLNPLMRFDGYYIFSDAMDLVNLNQRSMGQLKYFCERYVYGVRNAESPGETRSETFWLAAYGGAALVYRTMIFFGIVLFVADKWLLVGILMATICLVSWAVVPVVKLVRYLVNNPRLERSRSRAVLATCAIAAVLVILFGLIPFRHGFRGSGVVQAREWSQVVAEASGTLTTVLKKSGEAVKEGDALLILKNPELAQQRKEAEASIREVNARLRAALRDDASAMSPLKKRLESAQKLIERLDQESTHLTIRSRHHGIWVSSRIEQNLGSWIESGTPVGLVANPDGFEFSVTVLQEDVDRIFQRKFPFAEVRFLGESEDIHRIEDLKVVSGSQTQLPSPALGWQGGGDVAVNLEDRSGRTTAEPFFLVTGQFPAASASSLLHGRTGVVRFQLPREPLMKRWIRSLRQLLQRRFQL